MKTLECTMDANVIVAEKMDFLPDADNNSQSKQKVRT